MGRPLFYKKTLIESFRHHGVVYQRYKVGPRFLWRRRHRYLALFFATALAFSLLTLTFIKHIDTSTEDEDAVPVEPIVD